MHNTGQSTVDPRASFRTLVDAECAAGVPRQRAVATVRRKNPKLCQAMIDQANAGRRSHVRNRRPLRADVSNRVSNNPRAEFRKLVDAECAAGVPRQRAVAAVRRKNPKLCEAMIDQANPTGV